MIREDPNRRKENQNRKIKTKEPKRSGAQNGKEIQLKT